MGKQPAVGQKKSKDAIMKAAQSKKGTIKKKWTKGKVKEKTDNSVFVERATVEKYVNDAYKLGKVITIQTIVDKHKVTGSVSKALLRIMEERNMINKIHTNGTQWIYTPNAANIPKKDEPKQAQQSGTQQQKKGTKGKK